MKAIPQASSKDLLHSLVIVYCHVCFHILLPILSLKIENFALVIRSLQAQLYLTENPNSSIFTNQPQLVTDSTPKTLQSTNPN